MTPRTHALGRALGHVVRRLTICSLALPIVPSGHAQAPLVIRGVAVADVESGRVVSNQTIVIDGDRIVRMGSNAEIPTSAQVIAGAGLYAVPGLADLHVHLEADDLPLFIANGVTTVREMNGSATVLELRSEVRAAKRDGPSLYVSGPLLAGIAQQWDHVLIETAAEGRAEVIREAEAGYDFIKVYDGLSRETYQAIIDTAREHGLPVLGHIPASVGLDSVLDHDQTSIEHVEQIANATVGHTVDLEQIPLIVQKWRARQTVVTPTLAAMEILSSMRSAWFDRLFDRPEMRYAPTGVIGWWTSLRQPAGARATLPDTVAGGAGNRIEFYRELTQALAEGGATLLVGTDTPNPLLVPGFSLHHELEALVRAGLDPVDVLRAATLGAARHLEAEDEFGALRPGFRADIVLVAGSPFEDIANLRDVRGVIVRGEWFDGGRIAKSLEAVAGRRARDP